MPWEGPDPEPGDLIQFIHPNYDHWGIYVGDGYVVHLLPTESPNASSSSFGSPRASSCSSNLSYADVRKDKLDELIKKENCKMKVNNYYDTKKVPKPVEKILEDANEKTGKIILYDLTNYNCEHFATQMRYGEKISRQVEAVAGSVFATGAFAASLGSILGPAGAVVGVAIAYLAGFMKKTNYN